MSNLKLKWDGIKYTLDGSNLEGYQTPEIMIAYLLTEILEELRNGNRNSNSDTGTGEPEESKPKTRRKTK